MKSKTVSKGPNLKSVLPLPGEANASNIQLFLLAVIAAFVVGVILLELRSVLLPFVIAVLLSIIFSPMVISLKRRGVPTIIALVAVLLAFALVLVLFSLLVYSSTESFAREIPKYERKLTALITNLFQGFSELASRMNVQLEDFQWSQAFQLSSITGALTAGVGSFLNFFSNLFLVLLFMLFILAGSGQLADKIKKAIPANQASRLALLIRNTESQVRQYLLTKTLISAGTGLLTFIVLWAFGVDFPLVWALLAFVLNFIPNIGSLISVVFPVALSFLQFDSAGQSIAVLLLLTTMQGIMGNIIEPRLMAFQLNLSPLFVLASLIFWGWLWGVLGMILAVPLMATVKIVFENIKPLQPLSVLMGGSVHKS